MDLAGGRGAGSVALPNVVISIGKGAVIFNGGQRGGRIFGGV